MKHILANLIVTRRTRFFIQNTKREIIINNCLTIQLKRLPHKAGAFFIKAGAKAYKYTIIPQNEYNKEKLIDIDVMLL